MIAFNGVVTYGLGKTIAVQATVDTEPTSVKECYLKLFFAEDEDRSDDYLAFDALPTKLRAERRYNLPAGSPPRVEFDAPAGASGYAVQVSAALTDASGQTGPTVQVGGVTGETLAATLG